MISSEAVTGLRAGRRKISGRLMRRIPLLSALSILIFLWYLLTTKLRLLPLPYFPGPGEILQVG